ncbi:MAG: tRNA (N6-isopentenyl adenosine(37)-C2)-methylthiotransferase MiaB, partial [candidate division Zixibacteria bacterium]|nr:tRNA (N6-isopentenyl adenosine(37)-C2)-methylthiotransferase MiaB [candidate division Zixibacteria bacterium]
NGYEVCLSEDQADLIIVNTCSIREKAEERAFGRLAGLKPLKKKNPDLNIAVVGCMAQRLGERILKRVPHVDIVLGTDRMFDLPDILAEKTEIPEVHTRFGHEHIDDAPPVRTQPFSAYMTITRGCNNFCAFCIVPYVRGREVYHPSNYLVDQARKLALDGVWELTLLGQNVNSYRDGKCDFSDLILRIAAETDIQRIRYTSPHPKDLSLKLIDAHANEPKLMPHIHLPLQSGSDRILEKMSRCYRMNHYRNMVRKLRERCPEIALTTDVIVGFPTETEDDFQKTLDAFREIQYDSAFMFRYSEREGTRAAKEFPDDLTEETKIERLTRLIDLQKEISYTKNQGEIGKSRAVLVDGFSRRDKSVVKGKTPHGKTALFRGSESLIGSVVNIQIKQADSWTLHGEMINSESSYRPIGLFKPVTLSNGHNSQEAAA